MPPRPTDCDPERLRRLLDDRLDEAEQSAMADHLASCEPCRKTLDHMAAGTRWWREARAFLAPEEDPGHDATEAIHPADRPDPHHDSVDFLAPSDDPAHLGRIGPYEVVEVIGRGGMGVVLKGLDPSLNRFVAIKVLAPELATSASARRRFAREGQAAAAICHDHVVAIHAVDASGGLPYLVMQYVAGKSLQERIDQTGPLPVEEIVRIGMQAARGLAAAHAVGLIHRDVKPSNILLENGVERVKLVDFGLARAADDASLTQSGVVAGTPQYMSPEQAGGEPVDHRADLFSLGSVLYALCTGRPPFRAESTMAVLRRVSDDTPRPIRELNPEVPDWLEAIVMKLHAKDPADRFQTASEVALLLGRCLAYLREPKRGAPPYLVDLPEPPRRKRRLAIAAVGLLALVGLGAAGSEFVATILRIRTADGTMVIKVSDPDVKVKVDGEEVVITGVGPQELRVKPGLHTIESAKAGKVETKFVVVERGGKQAVEVGFEADGADGLKVAKPRPTDGDAVRNLTVSLERPRRPLARPDRRRRGARRRPRGVGTEVKGAFGSQVPSFDRLVIRVDPGLNYSEVLKVSKLLQDSKAQTITISGPNDDPAALSRSEARAPRVTVSQNGRPIDAEVTFRPARTDNHLEGVRAYRDRVWQRLALEKALSKEGDPLVQKLEELARVYELKVAELSGRAPAEWATNPRLAIPAPPPSATSGPHDADPWVDSVVLKGVLNSLRQELGEMRSAGGATPPTAARMEAIKARVEGLEAELAALGARGGVRPASATPRTIPSLAPSRQVQLRPTLPGSALPDPDGLPTSIASIAFAPDGKSLAVAGGVRARPGANAAEDRGLLGLWESDKGTLRILAAEPGAILSVAFAPDGKTLATGKAARGPPTSAKGPATPTRRRRSATPRRGRPCATSSTPTTSTPSPSHPLASSWRRPPRTAISRSSRSPRAGRSARASPTAGSAGRITRPSASSPPPTAASSSPGPARAPPGSGPSPGARGSSPTTAS